MDQESSISISERKDDKEFMLHCIIKVKVVIITLSKFPTIRGLIIL